MVERTPTLTAAVDAALVQVQKLQDTEFAAGANRLWLADLLQEVKKAAFECLTGGLCTLGDVLRGLENFASSVKRAEQAYMRRQRTSIDLNDLHITIDEAARFSQLALFPGTLLDIIAPNGDFSRVNLNPVPSDFFFGLLSGVTVPLRTASVLRSELLLQRRTRASIDVSGAYAGYTEAIRNAMAGMDGLLKIYEYMPRFEDAHRERALQFMRTELTPASFGTMFSFLWSLVDNSLNGMAPALSNDDCVLCLTVTNRLLSKCLPVKPNVQGIAAHVDAWDSLVSIFTCMARRTVTSLVLEDSSREERQAHISGLCKLAARLSAFRLEGGMREGSMGIAAIELGRRENLQAMNDLSAMLHEKAMRMKEDASPGAEEEAVWLLALAVCCPGMALAVRAACQGSHLEGWLELEQLRDGIAAIAAAWVGLAQVDSHCPELEIVGVFAVLGVALTNVRLFLKKEDDALPTTRTYPGARLRIWLQIGVNAAEMHACVPRMPGLLKNKNCANPSSNLLVFASDIGIMATKVSLKNEDRHNDREACLVAIQAATLANKVALAHTHLTPRAWERLYPRKRIVPVLLPDHEERILAEAAFERIFMLGQLYMKVATATLPGMIDADTSAADPDCKIKLVGVMLRVLHTLSSYIHYVRAFTMASIWSLASHLCLFKSEIEPALAGPEPCLNLLLEIAKTSKTHPGVLHTVSYREMIEGLEKLEAAAGEGSEASHLMESRIAYRYTALTQGQCSYVGCVTFRKPGEGSVPLTRCMQCHAVQYCGPGCEAVDWRHKMMCGVLAGSPSKKRAREEARDDEAMEGP